MKSIYLALATIALLVSGCSSDNPVGTKPQKKNDQGTVTLHMVDKNATKETKALYSNLWAIQSKGVMFGHHDDLLYGRNWKNVKGRSDVKDVCGDYPAVFSCNFAPIMDGHPLDNVDSVEIRRTILAARERGEVILATAHLDNPLTGGDAWDNSNTTVVSKILQNGSKTNIKFRGWLDRLANFLNNLKDSRGNLIPVIFRPFLEYNQTWPWWGKTCTTQKEFIDLWRFTVDYLRDKKDVHTLIYAVAPQFDGSTSAGSFLERWPGDNYVDFIGLDIYNGTNIEALSTNIKNLAALSEEKKKPAGVTETGIVGIKKNNGEPYDNYWTDELLTSIIGRRISMVVVWRNKYDPAHEGDVYYAPFKGQSSSADFIKFYNSPETLFSGDLPDMYKMAKNVIVK